MPGRAKDYGGGFLRGLTSVTQQQRAEARQAEDKKASQALAMLQMGLADTTGRIDPEALLAQVGPDLGFGSTTGKGAEKYSTLGRFLMGGREASQAQAQDGQSPDTMGSFIRSPEQMQALQLEQQQRADEAFVKRARANLDQDQAEEAILEHFGGRRPEHMIGPAGASVVTNGVVGERLPGGSAGAQPNVQTMMGVLADDPPGTAPRLFERNRETGQWHDSRDGQPITGEIQQRRAPRQGPDPVTAEINQLRLETLQGTAADRALFDEVPSDYRGAFDRATASGSPARVASQQAILARLWEQGNVPGAQEFIRQMAVENENVTTQNRVEGRREAIRQLDDLGVALDELELAGVDTGPVSGRLEDVARTVGNSTDPRLAALGNQMLVALQSYRLAVTGVQFGFNESQQYEGMFPNYRNELPVNKALLSGLRRAMNLNQQGFWVDKLGEEGAALVGAENGVLPPAAATPTNPFR